MVFKHMYTLSLSYYWPFRGDPICPDPVSRAAARRVRHSNFLADFRKIVIPIFGSSEITMFYIPTFGCSP